MSQWNEVVWKWAKWKSDVKNEDEETAVPGVKSEVKNEMSQMKWSVMECDSESVKGNVTS